MLLRMIIFWSESYFEIGKGTFLNAMLMQMTQQQRLLK